MLLLHDRCSVEVLGDLLVVRLVGSLDLTTSQHIYASFERLIAERKYGLALFDLSEAGVPSSDSRKWISHWFTQNDLSRIAVATFGTGLLVRTVNRMFDAAVSLLSRQLAPTRHFTYRAGAQAWLEERRKVFRGRAG